MIQMINTQKLVSLLKDEMSHDDLIAGLREIFDGYGKEIVHIERSIGDLPVSTGGNGGTTTWGSINGTLSDQTDLNAALSGKANVSHSHTGYEPTISKSTGYATWTGAAWSFKNESYSLSTHNHDGTYSLVSHDHSGVYSPVGHDHSGVYEPVISKSTGYLTWTGSAWSWKNEAYSLSSHNHSGVYATVIHNLIDTTNHPVSGLTTGHFLKATGATTYAFAAHGLTYSDVGAAPLSHTQASSTITDWGTYINQAVLTSSTPAFSSLSLSGSSGNTFACETSGLVYDATNNRVGIGTASPASVLHIAGNNNHLRLSATNSLFTITQFDGGAGNDAFLDVNGYPGAGTDDAVIRFFRSTNTTGPVYLSFHKGDGTTTENIRFGGNTNTWLNLYSGNVGIGTATWGTSAAKVLAIGNGTAPSTAPADAVQLWSADYAAGDARLYLKSESGTANIVIGNDQIIVSSLLKCIITVGGSATARTFTVNVRKFDGAAGTGLRVACGWWVSASEYGQSGSIGTGITYEITTGQEIQAESEIIYNHAVTDASGNLVLTVTTFNTAEPTALYFHIEVQGTVYTANGTVNIDPT